MRSCWSMPSICMPFLGTKPISKIANGSRISCATACSRPASFPPSPIRELRDLVRTHTHLMQERNRHMNRIHKILETANIKLSSVVTDIVGKSARQMLEALIAGESDPVELAKLARGRMRPKIALLQQALQGHLEPHHRFLLRETLAHLDFLQQRVGQLEQEVAERLSPFEKSLALLMTIPGISRRSATILIAELGTDMTAFPSAAHLASWVGLCPGSHLSAGKRRNGKPTKGNRYLRSVLTQIAWVLTRMRDNYLSAQFHHLRPRLGEKKAVVAVAHSVLVIVSQVLAQQEPYQDLGPDSFRRQDKEQQARRFVRQLETLGYRVELAPQEEVTPSFFPCIPSVPTLSLLTALLRDRGILSARGP